MSLKQKHSNTQADWLRAWENPGVSEEELERLENESVRFIQENVEGSVLCGHSFGKDSLVLYDLYKRAGFREGIFGANIWQFPSLLDYQSEHPEPDVMVLMSDKDWDWLIKQGPFSRSSEEYMRMHRTLNTGPINRYLDQNKIDTYVVGRRWADNNNIPKSKIRYRGKHQTKVIHPIADWSHEAILAYLKKYDIPLPSMYFMDSSGFENGTNAWAIMNIKDRPESEIWELLWKDEPRIVVEASHYLEEPYKLIAKKIKEEMGNNE